ncbi:protein maelstrom [Caerostris extrusa]|uniref:Protein maelstrom n=1 Tax=Caerostris extrusa TaxID=172846 RepID=A0AAV4TZ52_CAEEX|nr:protein maelstrom [Caerostris extrusa]
MARSYKNDSVSRAGKLASDGTNIEANAREMEELENYQNWMKQQIRSYVNSDCISKTEFKEIASRKMFYFMSFNILCQTENDYIPIELGLVEYSIRHGIHRELQMLIHPGRIPTGYTGQAKRLSEEVHCIDIFQGEEESIKDVREIYQAIKTFINPHDADEYPPIFCIEEDMERNNGCLQWLANQATDIETFEMWNAKYLLLELRAGVDAALPSLVIANDLITKTSFNYNSLARCEFHDEKDCHNCALAYCKRLCYLMSDAVCSLYDITLTAKHIPTRSSEKKDYVVTTFNDASFIDKSGRTRLDQPQSYYQNKVENAASNSVLKASQKTAASCVSKQMARLNLEMPTATVPGHGIGRGQRRKN